MALRHHNFATSDNIDVVLVNLNINGIEHSVDVEADVPLLWVIRDVLGLKGTKFGCGIGACGACTVHFQGAPVRSCVLPAVAAAGIKVTTIEGLKHAVQEAWIREQVPQCGYCQSGQLMAAAALLDRNPAPSDEDINRAMTNLCRCATYPRVRAGIHRAAKALATIESEPESPAASPQEDPS